METRTSKKLSGIKSTPSPPAAPSDREQRLQSHHQHQEQELDPLPQIQNEEGSNIHRNETIRALPTPFIAPSLLL